MTLIIIIIITIILRITVSYPLFVVFVTGNLTYHKLCQSNRD